MTKIASSLGKFCFVPVSRTNETEFFPVDLTCEHTCFLSSVFIVPSAYVVNKFEFGFGTPSISLQDLIN